MVKITGEVASAAAPVACSRHSATRQGKSSALTPTDAGEICCERFPAGADRVDLVHGGVILLKDEVVEVRQCSSGVENALDREYPRPNLGEAAFVLALVKDIH